MKHPVNVITNDQETGAMTDNRVIDHDNDSDRRWLGSHTYWAMRNAHTVMTIPVTEGGDT